MGTGRKFRKKPMTRPVKCARERRRRVQTQKRRLVALGMAEEKVEALNNKEVRDLLRHPAAIAG